MKKQKHASPGRNYRTELTITTLLLCGIALMTTDQPIHVLIQKSVKLVQDSYLTCKQLGYAIFVEPFVHLQVSDVLGLIFIATAMGLTIMHIRKSMISTAYASHSCPLCNSKLHRIHRSKWQLWLSRALYLSSGYYHCSACDHSSLRFYQKTPHLHRG